MGLSVVVKPRGEVGWRGPPPDGRKITLSLGTALLHMVFISANRSQKLPGLLLYLKSMLLTPLLWNFFFISLFHNRVNCAILLTKGCWGVHFLSVVWASAASSFNEGDAGALSWELKRKGGGSVFIPEKYPWRTTRTRRQTAWQQVDTTCLP